jgi:hypothetical protein
MVGASTRTLFAGGFNPQFMPSLDGICTLFSRWLTAASLWVHLLAVNLFAAREMYLEGGRWWAAGTSWHDVQRPAERSLNGLK